ncbi:hypothetical protein Nepgr_023366 [Nepenthes gracilis]|uniref:Uncharacterized protein n=1 Tax=Nepenthes gracilis TaxID=150966 RepID=A0AAD3XYZ2_NEPGR|nr:hypothetical protein Nepgr_023366 [Nepenthes gracilis]
MTLKPHVSVQYPKGDYVEGSGKAARPMLLGGHILVRGPLEERPPPSVAERIGVDSEGSTHPHRPTHANAVRYLCTMCIFVRKLGKKLKMSIVRVLFKINRGKTGYRSSPVPE